MSGMKLEKYDLHIGPRPGKKSFSVLEDLAPTHILTLQAAREQVQPVEKIAKRLAAQWLHFPIDGGKLDVLAAAPLPQLFIMIGRAEKEAQRPRIYMHCSAGIHRTGFTAYCLLRRDGLDHETALEALKSEREVTFEQLGEERIELAQKIFLKGVHNSV